MSSEPIIEVKKLGKSYQIYRAPQDRLKQSIVPRLRRWMRPFAQLAGRTIEPRQYYREFWALRDVSFEAAVGETVGIIGPNGSGKSTLLQLICGTLTPSAGEARVHGRVGALLELGSGFNPEFTGRENVYLNGTVLGLTRAEIDERLDGILAFADIGDFIDQPVKTYSSGMAIRLAFAVIAHIEADVLIVDEALSVGDAYFQQKCMRWLRAFRERGTLLFCGHDTAAVTSLCHHALWLDHGNVRAAGPAKEVCEAYMATVYARTTGLTDESVRPAKRVQETSSTMDRKINLSQIVEVMEFNENSASFGTGDATILDARMLDISGEELGLIQGGEEVQVSVKIRANTDIDNPIVGFFVKDRLGQPLFGDNTFSQYRNSNLRATTGTLIEAKFAFELPFLRSGDYSITAAIASGSIEQHVQHHWLHDSIIFKVHSSFHNEVIIAIPMQSITLELEDVSAPAQGGLGQKVSPGAINEE